MRGHSVGSVEWLVAWVVVWPSCAESVVQASGRVIGVDRGCNNTAMALPLSVVSGLRAINVHIVALTMAAGIDRIVMLLVGAKNLREVTMFPMNQQAQDLLMNAPSQATSQQLRDLHLRVAPTAKKD